MKMDEIRLMCAYNDWDDARLLEVCTKVSPEQYAAPASYGRGGLRATMVHILDNLWQQRITHAFPTLAVLRERWLIEQQELRAYLDTLTEETLNSTIRYVIPGAMRERVVWHILLDLILHATQHRSEAAALLTGYGQSPGDFDFTLFMNERA
jgi:uncharacterized damage-inducible protein DinB